MILLFDLLLNFWTETDPRCSRFFWYNLLTERKLHVNFISFG